MNVGALLFPTAEIPMTPFHTEYFNCAAVNFQKLLYNKKCNLLLSDMLISISLLQLGKCVVFPRD